MLKKQKKKKESHKKSKAIFYVASSLFQKGFLLLLFFFFLFFINDVQNNNLFFFFYERQKCKEFSRNELRLKNIRMSAFICNKTIFVGNVPDERREVKGEQGQYILDSSYRKHDARGIKLKRDVSNAKHV